MINFTVTYLWENLHKASFIPQNYVLWWNCMSVVNLPLQGSFCLFVRCVKVCMIAQSYCPLASGMSPQRTHHSQWYKWESAHMLLCRTALGEVWPSCVCRHTLWSVKQGFWEIKVLAVSKTTSIQLDRHDNVHVQYIHWDLTLTASVRETSLIELRGGYSLPSARSFSVTRWARVC